MLHSDIIYLACSGQKYATMGRRWRFVEYSTQHFIRAVPPSIIYIAYCQLYLKFVRTYIQIFDIICIYTIKYLKRKHQKQICEQTEYQKFFLFFQIKKTCGKLIHESLLPIFSIENNHIICISRKIATCVRALFIQRPKYS